MANDLAVLENQLMPLAPHFKQVLRDDIPPEKLIRTVIISCERLPKLLECTRQSVINAAMSAACLSLEVDGVTGQAFLIPFKGKAQLVIGYKGYNTLAARSGYTINGSTVKEGDAFDYMLGTGAFVHHKPKLGNTGRIIAAWSVAESRTAPPIVNVLSIDEIMAIKAKSPGARMSDSPWNSADIGFPAMSEKSSKRRLARSMPLNIMQVAARMEESFDEQRRPSWISPDNGVLKLNQGDVIEADDASPLPERGDVNDTPSAQTLTGHDKPDPMFDALKIEAAKGMDALRTEWGHWNEPDRARMQGRLESELKPIARAADEAKLRGTQPESEIIAPTKTAPKTDAEYRTYAEGWIAKSSYAAAVERWQSDGEMELRGLCNVTSADRQHLLNLIEGRK
jgi:recombination protein RecT